MRTAIERSTADVGLKIGDVTYVGDGKWDVEAVAALGLKFVGMVCASGRELLSGAGADVIPDDFVDDEEVLRHGCAGK